tara:strand:+ start:377 stop:1228 length:852 start_codon:yes stop_codon:yes gene_type:complete
MKYLHLLPLLAACHQAPIQSLAQDSGRTREGLTYKVLPGSDTQLHVFLDDHPVGLYDRRPEMMDCQLNEYMALQKLHDSGQLDAVFFEGVEQGDDIRDYMDHPTFVPRSRKRADIKEFLTWGQTDVRLFSTNNFDSPIFMGGWEREGSVDNDALETHYRNYVEALQKVEQGTLTKESEEFKTAEQRYDTAIDFFGVKTAIRTLHAYDHSKAQFDELDKQANAYAVFIGANHMHFLPGFDTLEQFIAYQDNHPTTIFYSCDSERLDSPTEAGQRLIDRVKPALP